jgi:hypothetical protein
MGGMKKIGCWVQLSICVVSAATVISACSQSSPTGGASTNNPLGDNYKGPPTPCDGDLSVKDAADLINGQTSVNHYSMLASMPGEGCELGAGQSFSAFIDIAITKSKPQFYANMLQLNAKHNPLPAVGDEAVSFGTVDSNIPDAKEINIMSRKGEWVCQAELIHKNGQVGDKALVSTNDDENAKKLGALCNKLFVAKHS